MSWQGEGVHECGATTQARAGRGRASCGLKGKAGACTSAGQRRLIQWGRAVRELGVWHAEVEVVTVASLRCCNREINQSINLEQVTGNKWGNKNNRQQSSLCSFMPLIALLMSNLSNKS